MPIYQLTNKMTHSRAVALAPSEKEAREMRPDGAFWQYDSWMVYDTRAHMIVRAKDLPEWPVTPKHVCADMLARHIESKFDVKDIVAFQRDLTPRQRGEGPDSWWEDEENDT